MSLKPQIRGADAGPTSCLLTASLDRTARVWHLDAPNDGAAAAAAPAMAHPGEVNSAKFDKAPGWDDLSGLGPESMVAIDGVWEDFLHFIYSDKIQYMFIGEYLAIC